MNESFGSLFTKKPDTIVAGDYYYDADFDGDQFDESAREHWLNGCFAHNWNSRNWYGKQTEYNDMQKEIIRLFSGVTSPFLEIACGPGMGLAPLILSHYPRLSCLATDACSLLIGSWREYIDKNLMEHDISLAQFSVMDIPLANCSFENVTSFIGLSSTRNGCYGQMQAIREIHRVLKRGGRLITIESDGWADIDAVKKAYDLWNPPLWKPFDDGKTVTWKEKFTECGFEIESCDKSSYHKWNRNDNEFGEHAEKVGIEIGTVERLYVLKKI